MLMMLMYVDVFFDVDDVEQFILILMKAFFFFGFRNGIRVTVRCPSLTDPDDVECLQHLGSSRFV